jgi:predicted alpha/beta hydrolase family esterase
MQFVIFHGSFGSKDGNWFPWLKTELEKLGSEVLLDQYPVDDFDDITKKGSENKKTTQSLESWMEFFEKNTLPKLKLDVPPIFVGHSMAPAFILHAVNKHSIRLDSAIYVSPFLEGLKNSDAWQFEVVNQSFHKTDFDWAHLKELIPQSYVLYGENDPYVPQRLFLDFGKKTSSSMIPVKNGGHLGGRF